MSNDRSIAVAPDPAGALTFAVVVSDARSESRHRVTMSAEDAARWSMLGADPARCVEAAMRFLLDREPKEAILGAFDIRVIARYFPEFENEFPDYLARIRAEAGGSG
jgi:hypothetical protein